MTEDPKEDVPPGLELCSDSFSVASVRSLNLSRPGSLPLQKHCSTTTIKPDENIDNTNEVRADKDKQDEHHVVSFSVQGIYTKWYPSIEQEKSKQRDSFICRRRMHTRHIDGFISDHPSKPWTEPPYDDVEEEEEEEEEEYKISVDEDGNEIAMFVPKRGLLCGYFWHEYDESKKVIREDRAILFQSQENYNHIISIEQFKSYFDGINYMEDATFGEQVIVNGIEISQLAIGDIFEIEGNYSPLVIEITAPRKPCNHINARHGSKFGVLGLKTYTHQNCLAGWFARVLIAGELRDGMKFIRKTHPNPKWTLTYIYKALYWEGNHRESLMNVCSWNRSRSELEEMISLPQLGEYEWKVEGRALLMKMDGIDLKKVRADLIDPQIDPGNISTGHFFPQFLCMVDIYQSINEVLKFLGITEC